MLDFFPQMCYYMIEDILNECPELKPFKAQIRSQILSWQREQLNKNSEDEQE